MVGLYHATIPARRNTLTAMAESISPFNGEAED
jgi:hypothetical protein